MCKDILRNRDDRREEDQTLAGGVLFFFTVTDTIIQEKSIWMQEKSMLFFTACCRNYDIYLEILICGDCAVGGWVKMRSYNMLGIYNHNRDMDMLLFKYVIKWFPVGTRTFHGSHFTTGFFQP